jgi:hypothetical protein
VKGHSGKIVAKNNARRRRGRKNNLAAAFGAITASAILKIVGKDDWALFLGQWPAAFLLMGVYNKMVKQHGSDAYSKAA